MRSGSWWVGGLLLLAVAVGCATGADDGAVSEEDFTGARDGGAEETSSAKLPPPSQPPSEEEDASTPEEDGGTGDAGNDAGDGGTNPPPTNMCPAPATCQASTTSMGSVSGDETSNPVSRQGTTSEFVTVNVSEDSSSVFGNSMEVKVVLVSPAGTNFDLYVYGSGTTKTCTALMGSSKLTTSTDTVGLEWGEGGGFSNGSDDDRVLTLEVRHVSGTCAPGSKWTLSVVGNQH